MLCYKYSQVNTPSQQLALDKRMLAWRGRLRFRLYNPGKIVKYGKMWNETGRDSSRVTTGLLTPSLSSIYGQLLQQHQIILSKDLHAKQTSTCGSIRTNSGLPKEFKQQSAALQRGEMTFMREGPVLLIAWCDKRVINMISTIYSADMKHFIQQDDIPEIAQSPASTSSNVSNSSGLITPSRGAPVKDPPYRLDGKGKEHVLLHIRATITDNTPTRRCSVCWKNCK
ncbi:hypothetical protein PR048_013313, partial [Dryococelus australis]